MSGYSGGTTPPLKAWHPVHYQPGQRQEATVQS